MDTAVLVAFSKQREPGYSTMLSLLRAGDEIGVCDVIVTEFFAGVRPADRKQWAAFFDWLEYWPVDNRIAIRAGLYRHAFARAGITISTPDALIAAVAVETDAIVVTSNARHYPMAGLQILVP